MINYSYNYNYNYINIHIQIHVIIPYYIGDCYINTIGDMQIEKYFYDHYNEFEYNHDFQIVGIIILHSLFFGIIRS